VDADTGDEVEPDDIVKGYKIDADTYITVDPEELEKVEIESSRTIEIDELVDRADIDQRYVVRPYYLVPDGKVGHDAYAVIRETNHPRHGQSRDRPPGADQSRAHHSPRAHEKGPDGPVAARSL
jgi:Ku protein